MDEAGIGPPSHGPAALRVQPPGVEFRFAEQNPPTVRCYANPRVGQPTKLRSLHCPDAPKVDRNGDWPK